MERIGSGRERQGSGADSDVQERGEGMGARKGQGAVVGAAWLLVLLTKGW